MIKLTDDSGNEIEVTQDYSSAEVLYEGVMYFGEESPEDEVQAAYFFNDLYQGLESVSKGGPFSATESPYSKDEIYALLIKKGFLEVLRKQGYSECGQPYFDSDDGIFTNQISYAFMSLDVESQEITLGLYNGKSQEYIVRVDGTDYLAFINEAKEEITDFFDTEEIKEYSEEEILSKFFDESDFLYYKKQEISSSVGIGYFDDSLNFFNPVGTSKNIENDIENLLKFMDDCAAEVGEDFRYL